MNHKTLGDIFQEINDKFAFMEPANIDQLEDRVLAAMHKLCSYLMESKITGYCWRIRFGAVFVGHVASLPSVGSVVMPS